ncbi:MAG: heterodisulfide reductase-related iron-sulfur binding cluster, partial [Pseudomonadota bacterium]|nr:heterodisulfide reductase-related iron-sulfur binding cluster [Pseudomonadota bacterium]
QKWPATYNWLQSRAVIKSIMGVDKRRTLPLAYSESLQAWWKSFNVKETVNTQGRVWVLCDLFSQYQEPKVGKAVLESLNAMGLEVEAVFLESSPRALISQGLLDEAKQGLLHIVQQLEGWSNGDYIVGIEPSELLTWRDEAKDLLKDSLPETQHTPQGSIKAWSESVLSYEELVLALAKSNQLSKFKKLNRKVWLHVHCHQKALANPVESQKALELIPGVGVEMISSGCCGMSGDFGYKHYEVSKLIANQVLLPTLEQASSDDWIVATGTSCRHQLAGLGQYSALHIAQVFNQVIEDS